MIYKDR